MTDLNREIGQRARAAREAADMSLRAVCAALPDVPGMDPVGLSERERGLRPWTAEQVVAVAPVLGTTPSALLGDDDGEDTDPVPPAEVE